MWTDFFLAAAGASAALAGLVFVSLSVNIDRILKFSNLPSRSALTIGALMLILVTSMAALVPRQRPETLGMEILIFAAVQWLLEVWAVRKALIARTELHRPRFEWMIGAVAGQVETLPFIVGGIQLHVGHEAGFYWVARGTIAAFILSVLNAWVLLVEILR
jgi:hypothetical protein